MGHVAVPILHSLSAEAFQLILVSKTVINAPLASGVSCPLTTISFSPKPTIDTHRRFIGNDVGCSAAEGLIDGLESGLGNTGCVSWVLEGRKLCCYKSCSRVADSASSRFALFTSNIKEISSALARLLDQIVRTSHPSSPFRTEPTEKYLLTTRCYRTQPYGVRTALSACSTARSAAH